MSKYDVGPWGVLAENSASEQVRAEVKTPGTRMVAGIAVCDIGYSSKVDLPPGAPGRANRTYSANNGVLNFVINDKKTDSLYVCQNTKENIKQLEKEGFRNASWGVYGSNGEEPRINAWLSWQKEFYVERSVSSTQNQTTERVQRIGLHEWRPK